jgi:hypothetical protein
LLLPRRRRNQAEPIVLCSIIVADALRPFSMLYIQRVYISPSLSLIVALSMARRCQDEHHRRAHPQRPSQMPRLRLCLRVAERIRVEQVGPVRGGSILSNPSIRASPLHHLRRRVSWTVLSRRCTRIRPRRRQHWTRPRAQSTRRASARPCTTLWLDLVASKSPAVSTTPYLTPSPSSIHGRAAVSWSSMKGVTKAARSASYERMGCILAHATVRQGAAMAF